MWLFFNCRPTLSLLFWSIRQPTLSWLWVLLIVPFMSKTFLSDQIPHDLDSENWEMCFMLHSWGLCKSTDLKFLRDNIHYNKVWANLTIKSHVHCEIGTECQETIRPKRSRQTQHDKVNCPSMYFPLSHY